jgi:hypothetical protein
MAISAGNECMKKVHSSENQGADLVRMIIDPVLAIERNSSYKITRVVTFTHYKY